jgi:predicted kinase
MHPCHLVCGPPAAGKTSFAKALAGKESACLLDSDDVAEGLVRAGLSLAGKDPDDRDSPTYKKAFRDPVYDTLFHLAGINLHQVPVVLCGPFTSEASDPDWPAWLEGRLGVRPELHFVWCPPDLRRQRLEKRGEPRDRAKLAAWDDYLRSCRETPPVWPHHFIRTYRV